MKSNNKMIKKKEIDFKIVFSSSKILTMFFFFSFLVLID